MESNSDTYFEETHELVKKYTDDRILLLKIQTAKKTAKLTSKIVFIFIASVIAFFVLMFIGFMSAYYFAEKMNNTMYGFATVAGIFAALLLLFMIIYKSYFSGKIKDMITEIFFESDPYDLNEDDEA